MKPRLHSEADFAALLTSLAEDTFKASVHWRLYQDLISSARNFAMELEESRAFWRLTVDAQRDTTLFRLARLYDPDALSLPTLLSTIKQNLRLFEKANFRDRLRVKGNPFADSLAESASAPDALTLDADCRSVSGSDDRVARLLEARNRVFAHRDPGVLLGTRTDPTETLTIDDVDALVQRAAQIMNRYRHLFEATVDQQQYVGQDDYKLVFQRIRTCRETRQRELEREYEAIGIKLEEQ
jgi:HEPN superfamily AbiU2-like protein